MAVTMSKERPSYLPLSGDDLNDRNDRNDLKTASASALGVSSLDGQAPRTSSRWSAVMRVMALTGLLLLLGRHLSPSVSWQSAGQIMVDDDLESLPVEERVSRILEATPLIDGHDDFPIFIRERYNNHIYTEEFKNGFERDGLPMHVDIPRLRAGKNGGAFWSVFVPCPENGTDLSNDNYAESVRDTLLQIDLVARLKKAYPAVFSPDVNSSTALAAFARGQLISPLGVEGLHQIGNSIANLREYHRLGVRYATLTHNCPNKYADAALWEHPFRRAPKYWGGLSPLGRKVVREMNRLGLIVDLSHTSFDTQEDVLGGRPRKSENWTGSLAPTIYSHSSAYSVCPHPRNVPDHILQLVKKTNGLVMVNFSPDFISCHWTGGQGELNGVPTYFPGNATLEHVATHIIHIGELIGFEHVGLGSDFDGIGSTPRGLDDVSAYPALVAELLRRNVTDAQAAQIVGGNLLRVWKDVDTVAERLQAEGELPLEDDLEGVL